MKYRNNLISLYITILVFTVSLSAEPLENDHKDFSLRIGGGYSDFNDLGEILIFDFSTYEGNTYVLNLDGGWRFVENMMDLPFDWYLKGGLSYFNENGLQDDLYEGTLYVKVYYKWDFMDNRVRIGFGEGLSWASDVPIVEVADAVNSDKEVAKLLNYLEISADFDLGRLIGEESLKDLYLGYTIKHRSGVFGLFSGVHGGSNYQMLTIEKNF
jgi:outer membrane protein